MWGLGFSPRGRTEIIRRIGEVSRIMENTGLHFPLPRCPRQRARGRLPTGKCTEVYVST